jgi:hypothetical protein
MKKIQILACFSGLVASLALSTMIPACEEIVNVKAEDFVPAEIAAQQKGASIPQKITVVANGVTFNSDYDNGSLGAVSFTGVTAGQQVYAMNLHSDVGELGTATYWFRFTMDGVADRSMRLNLDHSQNLRPVIRFFDASTSTWSAWRRMTASEASTTSRMDFVFSAGQDRVELAFFFPLGLQETYDRVNALVATSPHASTTTPVIQSLQGNNFLTVTVNDSRFPDSQKQGIWVHSRAHAGEVTSTWCLVGFLDQFLANDEWGQRLRRHCRLDMLVLQNVDGVEWGNTRWDSQGVDPERWSDASNQGVPGCLVRSPAIASQTILKDLIDARLASNLPPVVALNLHSTSGAWDDTFFFQRNLNLTPAAGQALVTESFRTLLQDYVDALDDATPLFANADPQFSTLNLCSSTSNSRFVESYFFTMRGEATMAMTHEGYYRTRGHGDFGYWTDEEYIELGRGMARALVDHLSIPQLPASVSDAMMVY